MMDRLLTYNAISNVRCGLAFTSPVFVRGDGAGQHPRADGLLAERGTAVASPPARWVVREGGQEGRKQLLIAPSRLLPVKSAVEHTCARTNVKSLLRK